MELETARLVKPPGYDWTIRYRYEGEGVEEMLVFGKIKIEDAIEEARNCLDSTIDLATRRVTNDNAGTYEILAVSRHQ